MDHEHITNRRSPELRWALLDDITLAKRDWSLTDRSLSVLRALLGFLPKGARVQLTVFPSNKTLARRLYGMPESTLRRHLARLIEAGLIVRRPSPNGKRYRVGQGGELCFGFDLSPVFARAQIIRDRAAAMARRLDRIKVLRQRIRLAMARAAMAPEDREVVQKLLRRKVEPDHLYAEVERIEALEPDVAAAQNERHLDSQTDSISCPSDEGTTQTALEEVASISGIDIRCPRTLERSTERAALALGLRTAWALARREHGDGWAALAVAFVHRRRDRVENPGGYLYALVRRARTRSFDLMSALGQGRAMA